MIVLDASVVIALLTSSDAQHLAAVRLFRRHERDVLMLHAVTRAEVLVGPVRSDAARVVDDRLRTLRIGTVPLQEADVLPLADVRARTGLRMPDACVVYAAFSTGATVASFDDRLRRAAEAMGVATLE